MSLPESGEVVAGRYRLEAPLGSGASATVFRAFDVTLVRRVAIKFLLAGGERRRDEFGERFQREARLAAAVDHPNVMRTLDFGTADGRPYMVMELLQGQTLAARMATAPRLKSLEAVEIMLGVLAGLGAVHRAGIVHRDLKPENVYLAEDGAVMRPKIMDFGVSRVARGPRQGVRSALTTQDGMIIGTPEYMSPEQARGMKEIDARSDLYGAGVMLFEMLTDSLPYEAETMADLLVKISQGGAPSPAERRPELPAGLCAVVVQAMAHDPASRFSDARAMANALCSVMGLPPQAPTATDQASLADLSDVLEPNRSASLPVAALPGLQTQTARLQDSVGELQLDPSVAVRVRRVAGSERRPAVGVVVPGERIGRQRGRDGFPTGWLIAALVLGVLGYRLLKNEDHKLLLNQARRALGAATSRQVGDGLPVADRITIRLQGVPATAVVVLDGTVQQATEFELPADGALHYLEVQQRGMRTWSASFEALRDRTFAVLLVEERPRRR